MKFNLKMLVELIFCACHFCRLPGPLGMSMSPFLSVMTGAHLVHVCDPS